MTDENAKYIAEVYADNLNRANRIGISDEAKPMVSVCLTLWDMIKGTELEQKKAEIAKKLKRLTREILVGAVGEEI